MKLTALALSAGLAVSLPHLALAQDAKAAAATSPDTPTISCADVMKTPAASAADIAALTADAQVEVVQCKAAEADVTPATATNLEALRAAASANPTVSSRLVAAGSAPARVVLAAPRPSGGFTFYVIGAYR